MNLFIQETHVNVTKGYRYGNNYVYETPYETHGELFRALQREHGRCIGRVYIEEFGEVKEIGWVFQKREQYEDVAETFLAETWVTVHSATPTTRTQFHYAS